MDFFKLPDPTEREQERVEREMKKQKEYHFVGSAKKVPGHTLFSFNVVTKEIKPAQFMTSDTIDFWTHKPLFNPRVITERDCIYRQALNRKNLIKRLRREGFDI